MDQTAGNTTDVTLTVRDIVVPSGSFVYPSAGAITSSASFGFNVDGTGTNATVSCAHDSGTFGACSENSCCSSQHSDSWTATDGQHTEHVRVTDGGGNVFEMARTITVDRTPPTLTITGGPASGSWSATPSVTYTFSYSSDVTRVRCSDSSSIFLNQRACTTAQSDTITPGQGSHYWSIEVTDAAGNGRFVTKQYNIDTIAPTVTQTSGPTNGTATSSTSPTVGFTYDGTGSTGTVTCAVDAAPAGPCTSLDANAGSGSEQLTGLADQSSHTVTVTVTDQAGNTTSMVTTFTVDTTLPTVDVTSAPAAYLGTDAADIVFTASSNSALTLTCALDGASHPCTSSTDDALTGLTDGAHTWSVTATKQSTGSSTTEERSFTVDTADPTASFTTGPAEGEVVAESSPAFEFAADGTGSPATVSCTLDDAVAQPCSSDTSELLSNIADGSHTLTVTVTDAAGNGTTLVRHFTVDTVAPAVRIGSGPADGSAVDSGDVSFFFSSERAAALSCSLDSDTFAPCTGSGDDEHSGLADGGHVWKVEAVDAAGNSTVATRSFTVDTVAPQIVMTTGVADAGATNDTRPTIGFSTDGTGTEATATCAVDGRAPVTCADSFQPPTALAEGSHTVTVQVTDAAGNQAQASRTFTVDTTAPSVSIGAGPANGSAQHVTSAHFFFSTESGTSVDCRFDTGDWGLCSGTGDDQVAGLADGAHTWRVRATDRAGNATTATRTFTVDTVAPTVAWRGSARPFSLGKAAWSWTPYDGLSGVATSTLRYRTARFNSGFGAWRTLRASTATSRSLAIARGQTACAEVEVRDKAGNVSRWTAQRCTAVPLDDRSLTASSGWQRPTSRADYAHTRSTTTRRHATLTLRGVQARRIELLVTTCSRCGSVSVTFAGTRTTLSLHSARTRHQVALPVRAWSALHTGTLRITVTTSGRSVTIDGLGISATR
ncbi:MAG TPA: Ig-like domain-containing protein [Mycobacteriales bacterium]|nr:Ig-like domain-containing protein [Mycobacteriales bacterium]